MLAALVRAAPSEGVRAVTTRTYQGQSDVLVVWGPGAPNRVAPMQTQLGLGRHVVAFDLAYWHRDTKVRLSIDAAHPQDWVMRRAWPPTRFLTDQVPVTDTSWTPTGPVILAGLGLKARVQYGADRIDAWERQIIAQARSDGRVVRYRRKQGSLGFAPRDCALARDGPIESALTGASLVATWHSNVAVDAIRMGLPVICRDGAAAAVCGDTYRADVRPLQVAIRDQFLANLAWFQWAPQEARACWRFLEACWTP